MTTDVAIYLPSLTGGGAERIMVTLANEAAAKGLAVDLVLASAEGPFLEDVTSRVRIVDLKSKRVISSLPGLIRYLRREKPKSTLSALNHANIIAILARKLSGSSTRLVVSEHNNLSISLTRKISWRSKIVLSLMGRLYPWADGIIAVSGGVRQDLIQLFKLPPEKVSVIYNPIVTPDLLRQTNLPIDHPWFEAGEPPVILGVGRLTRQKDFPTLIRAVSMAHRDRDCRLIILGDGELRNELQALADELGMQDRVMFAGFVNNPYVWMAHASLFVLSSEWEGFGNVLVEAMACGTPVVSTACPSGPAEILEDGRWGKLVPVGNSEIMARAILDSLSSRPIPSESLIERAKAFSSSVIADQYIAALLPYNDTF